MKLALTEPEMTRAYAIRQGGELLHEHRVAGRYLDGVLVKRGTNAWPLDGKRVDVIETKRGKLSRTLLGQALFGRDLVKSAYPRARSVGAVALCGEDDPALSKLAKRYRIKIVVGDDELAAIARRHKRHVIDRSRYSV